VRHRLNLVRLEDRAVPATFTVSIASDSGNNAFPDTGGLREAILKANANPGADTIAFNIPGGAATITPASALPPVTGPVTIDATTQPGYAGTPVITLAGKSAGGNANGLNLVGHAGSTVRGFSIAGFGGAGIRISASGSHNILGNTLGGSSSANFIGILLTDATTGNTVGGTGTDRNLIAGNTTDGIRIESGATQNSILGNYIGTDANGTSAVPNKAAGIAIVSGARDNLVGGFAAGAGNIIAGNGGPGVLVSGGTTAGNTIAGNRIGGSAIGTALPNTGDGIRAENGLGSTTASDPVGFLGTTIKSNNIQYNSAAGVSVRDTSRFVYLEGNTIANNGSVGLAVDATAQDNLQPPTPATVTLDAADNITVAGSFLAQPGKQYTVHLFSNSAADPTGSGEGQFPIGTVAATADVGGNATFTFTTTGSVTGSFITAYLVSPDKDTSAFSAAKAVPNSPVSDRFFAVGLGGAEDVRVYRGSGALAYSFSVFGAGGNAATRVAMADFNRDGTPDVVAGTGPGRTTRVEVRNGETRAVLFSVQPFEDAFSGGVYVAAADLNADGVPELVITPDEGGGPRVDIYSGVGFTKASSFFGIDDPAFRGGARPATGDLDGDGQADLVVAAGFGGGPRVAGYNGGSAFRGNPTRLFSDFFAFEESLRNGVFVALGDLDGDSKAELIAGGGPGGGPRVTAFSGAGLRENDPTRTAANFFAGDPNTRGGVRVAARDLNADGLSEVLAGTGPGATPAVDAYSGLDLVPGAAPEPRFGFDFDAALPGGVFVG
jgi:trimeric autotransporter adhesin